MSNFSHDLRNLWAHYSAFFIVGILVVVLGGLTYFAPSIIARLSGEERIAETVEEDATMDGRAPRVAARSGARVEVRNLQDLLFLHHDAMGGRQAIERINALRLAGVLIQNEEEVEFVIIKKKPRQVRMNISNPNARNSYIFDGTRGQVEVTTAQGTRVTDMSEEQLINFELDSEIFTPISDPTQALSSLKYLGSVEFQDGSYHCVEFTRSSTIRDLYYINPETYLIDYMERFREDPAGLRKEFYYYTEYRQVEGVPIAFKIEQVITGVSDAKFSVRFSQVEWNPGLFGNFFRLRQP